MTLCSGLPSTTKKMLSLYLSPVHFPPEIWSHIFGYLSVTDKGSVRAVSKYFKKLIDHSSLWKDWTVVLSFEHGAYNRQFWDTLRRRKVFSVVMRSTKAKHWGHLSQSLPAVTTVVVEASHSKSFNLSNDFPHLTRLALRNISLLFDTNLGSKLQNLTHLSICGVTTEPHYDLLFRLLPHLRHLTSLVCHRKTNICDKRVRMVDILVSHLPQLKHLSLSVDYAYPQVRGPGFETGSSLSSLELVDCLVDLLPDEDTLKLIPSLKCLGVFYQFSNWRLPTVAKDAENLNRLLLKFKLTKLVIFRGGPLSLYVTSIPATVTSLTLCLPAVSPEDLAVLAVQVPNLLHLHIDLWPSNLGARTAQIPQLFPKLRSLRLRQEHVPEKDFLCLHQLQDLQILEVLDWNQNFSDLADKFRALTKHRVQIVTSRQRDALICSCVCQVY